MQSFSETAFDLKALILIEMQWVNSLQEIKCLQNKNQINFMQEQKNNEKEEIL